MFNEIMKLHALLIKADIPHEFSTWVMGEGYQIRIYADRARTKEIDDVVCHRGSHGYHLGLLETYILNDCEGFETAEQVFEGWCRMYANALKKSKSTSA